MQDGRSLKQLYRQGQRGQQVYLEGISYPVTVSWFWLKRTEGKRELRECRFDLSLFRRLSDSTRTLIAGQTSGFFKTITPSLWAALLWTIHAHGRVYRWLILSLIAYLLAHWIDQWSLPPVLDWKAASHLAKSVLFPSILWFQLLRLIRTRADIAAQYGFEIALRPLPDWAYRDCCKI